MTALQLLDVFREKNIRLEVDGDRLFMTAPAGALPDDLRPVLSEHKRSLRALLGPVQFVTLKGGLTVPVPAVVLAIELEARGVQLGVDEHHHLQLPADVRLTPAETRAIERWRVHLGAIVEYCVRDAERPA